MIFSDFLFVLGIVYACKCMFILVCNKMLCNFKKGNFFVGTNAVFIDKFGRVPINQC